ncbi:hypothetical protein L218DRAFT_1004327 [Marasmius fiardii PR-910]|nr:hypothetical protein L218DRAFT_1004327 [Marasmius fiardii PR-910]
MTDEDGNIRLFRLAEVENSPDDNIVPTSENEGVEDEKIWAWYNDADSSNETDCESESSYGPAGGSQYTSDAESEPDERTGFMYEYDMPSSDCESYTHQELYERCVAMNDHDLMDSQGDTTGSEMTHLNEHIRLENSQLKLNFNEYFNAILDTARGSPTKPNNPCNPNVGKCPIQTATEKRCLAGWIELNGVKAFTLFDSGSTADAISPNFTRAAKIKVFQLENPVMFQLGTKGSHSQVTHGCISRYSVNSARQTVNDRDYFDIANVDRYDAVVSAQSLCTAMELSLTLKMTLLK